MSVSKRVWKTTSGEIRTAWVVRYYDADKKYRSETCSREREAKAREAQIKVDLKKGVHRPDGTSITVSEAGALWLRRCADEELEFSTIASYNGHLRLHIEPATVPKDVPNGWSGNLGGVKLSQLTSPLCLAFSRQLLKANARDRAGKIITGKGISRRSACAIFTSFKAILKEAQASGLITHNPAQPIQIKIKTREEAPSRIGEKIPSKEDMRAIFAASAPEHFLRERTGRGKAQSQFQRDRWYPLFLTAAFTGMRSSELRGLIWSNVDLDGCVIHVRQRADCRGTIGPCKSVSGYREIQIPDAVAAELRRWRTICPVGHLKLVFPNGIGNVEMHSTLLVKGWYAVQHRIGMERPNRQAKYGFHALRHFYASIMIDQGTPPKRLQSLLGHKTLSMTMDIYGHLFPAGTDETARANKAVTSVLGG